MGTTSNNSWPYPESSDYVADGATAIENLADAIDTSLGTTSELSKGYILSNTFGDRTLTTSGVDVGSITFTLTESRYILLMIDVGMVDAISGAAYFTTQLTNANNAGTPSVYYLTKFVNTPTITNLAAHAIYEFASGTHTVYWTGYTPAGSCRFNSNGGTAQYNQITAIDLGAH